MNITIDISEVDYIALCPGYTSRLLHEENRSEWKLLTDADLLEKIRTPQKERDAFIKQYGYSTCIENINYIPKVELKFWPWGYWEEGDEVEEREHGSQITNSPCYQRLLEEFETREEMLKYDSIPELNAKPLLIDDGDIYILEDLEESKVVINTFYPKWGKDIYGSIIFGSANSKFHPKLELVNWKILAKSISIGFCSCYDPLYPYAMKLISANDKTMLIVKFDCESG